MIPNSKARDNGEHQTPICSLGPRPSSRIGLTRYMMAGMRSSPYDYLIHTPTAQADCGEGLLRSHRATLIYPQTLESHLWRSWDDFIQWETDQEAKDSGSSQLHLDQSQSEMDDVILMDVEIDSTEGEGCTILLWTQTLCGGQSAKEGQQRTCLPIPATSSDRDKCTWTEFLTIILIHA